MDRLVNPREVAENRLNSETYLSLGGASIVRNQPKSSHSPAGEKFWARVVR